MNFHVCSKTSILRKVLLFVVALSTLQSAAHAADDAAIKAAFMSDPIMLFSDLAGADWSIAQAPDEMEALGAKALFKGTTDAHGNAKLTNQQRATLYAKWVRTPRELWYIQFPNVLQITAQLVNGSYRIALLDRRAMTESKQAEQRHAERVAAKNTPLPSTSYTQIGFDSASFTEDFENWRTRFKADLERQVNKSEHPEYEENPLDSSVAIEQELAFPESIDSGPKGLDLARNLMSNAYAYVAPNRNKPSAINNVFTQLLLSKYARPVGYGGTFIDQGIKVELWYMAFEDMSEWSMEDFNESLIFSAFKQTLNPESVDSSAPAANRLPEAKAYTSAKLPIYQELKRNSWPALVFVRGADGNVKLYGMSMEMARILETIFNKQLG